MKMIKNYMLPLRYLDESKLPELAFSLHTRHTALSRTADSLHRHKPLPGSQPDPPYSSSA